MKIALIGQFDWYGCMGNWVYDGFDLNYHKVDKIDRNDIIFEPNKYDILFYVDCSEDYSKLIPKCKDCPPKIFWSMDAHMPGGAERSVNIGRKCDLVFSSNYEYGVEILKKFGIDSFLMPITYNDRYVKNCNALAEPYDVVMIGHANSNERIQLWDMLHDNFNAFTGKANTRQEYSRIMSHCKIVINQPTEPWNMILNNRFFEALGFKKLLLQKRLTTSLIEKLGFKENVDFIYWDNLEDLRRRLILELNNINESIIKSGHYKALKYSMKNQCSRIESVILSKFYNRL